MWYYSKSFDFDKSIKVYFTDRANYKGIKSEYVDDVPIPAPVKKDKPVSAPVKKKIVGKTTVVKKLKRILQ
jgi:hypothetical protein